MEGDSGAAERLYRLRLVLPDLSQSFVGNCLASLEKSIPPELFHDFDDLFDAPEIKRDNDFDASKRIEAQSKHQTSADADADADVDSNNIVRLSAKIVGHELWLRAGEMPPRGPLSQTWELCHELENWALDKSSENCWWRCSPLTQMRFKTTGDDDKLSVVKLSSKSAQPAQSEIIAESALVRDALYALQGLPASVRKLERLSKIYCTTSTDKSARSLSTLWTRSVTASALGKVLSVVSRAGHVRYQLDAFVNFFLDDRLDPYENKSDSAPNQSRRAFRKKKKKRVAAEIKESEKHPKSANSPDDARFRSEKKVPRQCLVNQAFALTVRGILRGHSAALNTLAASVSLRRDQETTHGCKGEDFRDQDPGPVIGYWRRDISLLEFYLHTRELRIQLHALGFLCLMREGKSFIGKTVSDSCLEDFVKTKENEGRHVSRKGRKSEAKGDDRCDPLVRSFDNFPRGADLLTYLYDQLTEVDPLHMELLRFLFERAYEPYSIFIQSWLYQAAVSDPYGEFIIEQADFGAAPSSSKVNGDHIVDPHPRDLKLRSGLHVPRFMESICIPLIRAGEQLQVLLKLAETCELAQQMANNTCTSESFWPQDSTQTPMESSKSSSFLPPLCFSKRKLAEIAKQREKKSREMSELFDILFTDLASTRMDNRSRASSCPGTPANLSPDVINESQDESIWVRYPEPQQQTSLESHSNMPTGKDLLEQKHLEICVILPKRGWLPSEKDEFSADNSVPSSKVKSLNLQQVGETKGLESMATKEMEIERTRSSWGPADISQLALDIQDPIEGWFHTDSRRLCTVVERGERSTKIQSLIADHKRGTSWPLWGLPLNPFLAHKDIEDFASNTYLYPSFTGTYQHWDVTAKRTIASVTIPPMP